MLSIVTKKQDALFLHKEEPLFLKIEGLIRLDLTRMRRVQERCQIKAVWV